MSTFRPELRMDEKINMILMALAIFEPTRRNIEDVERVKEAHAAYGQLLRRLVTGAHVPV